MYVCMYVRVVCTHTSLVDDVFTHTLYTHSYTCMQHMYRYFIHAYKVTIVSVYVRMVSIFVKMNQSVCDKHAYSRRVRSVPSSHFGL